MLEFENASFSYGEKKILENFSFSLKEGTSVSILGPSGYGKTTLLNLAAGFLRPESGKVSLAKEKTAVIFQEDRLLPWYTALENLTAVNIEKEKALEYLEKVGLSDCADKYPDELSGGMCRRLAIARALAFGGKICLFDEPLRGLDVKTSAEILELIITEISGKTSLVITHNPKEAFSLSERIVVVGKSPLQIIADRNKSDFSDEKAFSYFIESVI